MRRRLGAEVDIWELPAGSLLLGLPLCFPHQLETRRWKV